MNNFLLGDDFHLGGKFEKANHLSIVKKTDVESRLPKMISKRSVWLTRDNSFQSFVSSASLIQHQISLKRHADLIIFGNIDDPLKRRLASLFKNLVIAKTETSLPVEELIEVINSKSPESYVITGEIDKDAQTVFLVRGNLETLVVPFAAFIESGDGTKPDFDNLVVTDHGQTVALGNYEAAVDSLLYEFDPEFRKERKKERTRNEKTLGACIKRLRLTKGVRQSDFPGIDEKEIGRIERGEVKKPHKTTLEKIASHLGVAPDEILDF